MRSVAERLIAHEAKVGTSSEVRTAAAFPVCEKLRPHLATLLGNTGFHALLSRALALANVEVPWLRALQVNADGSLDGLDKIEGQAGLEEIAEGGIVLVAQLLRLLVAFIGEALTMGMLREIWPKLSFDNLDSGKRRK
jgi:hypothetical protein